MHGLYILNGKHAVPEPDFSRWGAWWRTADRIVQRTHFRVSLSPDAALFKDHPITGAPHTILVSTVFLGMDHNHFSSPPLLFETMIFGGPWDEEQWRYPTWEEAEAGHQRAIELIKGCDNIVVVEDALADAGTTDTNDSDA